MKKTLIVLTVFILTATTAATAAAKARDKVGIGQDVRVKLNEVITGNIVAVGSNAWVAGTVGGDILVLDGNAELRSTAEVMGDVLVFGGRLRMTPGAKVLGQTISGTSAIRSVMGGINSSKRYPPVLAVLRIIELITWLVICALIMAFCPRQQKKLSSYIESNYGHSLFLGILIALAFIPLVVFLFITLIGMPLVPFLVFSLAAAIIFGRVGISLLLGTRIIESWGRPDASSMSAALLGILVISIIEWLPFAGGLISAIVHLTGLGAVLASKFGTGEPWISRGISLPTADAEELTVDSGRS